LTDRKENNEFFELVIYGSAR